MKKWNRPEIGCIEISATEYGWPNEKIDLTFFGVPIGDGPDNNRPQPQPGPTPDPTPDVDPTGYTS
ncbi:hypothetical protein [Butyrivibrio sp. WCE2006]|uniref:hypothetical protein n=1 Tax=Butyrivibrio sp. WCE2006 TaxID=1410611 RepID=UPI0005D26A77|nr:hypothetical protein [Butyrivibrio sp. WCE2006]